MTNVRTRRRLQAALDPMHVSLARLRGAALAIAAAAARAEQFVAHADACPDEDHECLTTRYAGLLRQRDLVRRASDELERLERAAFHDELPGGPLHGWHVPYVRVTRDALDRANDIVVTALGAVRSSLDSVGVDPATA